MVFKKVGVELALGGGRDSGNQKEGVLKLKLGVGVLQQVGEKHEAWGVGWKREAASVRMPQAVSI